jgi:hypothetical protein
VLQRRRYLCRSVTRYLHLMPQNIRLLLCCVVSKGKYLTRVGRSMLFSFSVFDPKMAALLQPFETSVNIYQLTWHDFPKTSIFSSDVVRCSIIFVLRICSAQNWLDKELLRTLTTTYQSLVIGVKHIRSAQNSGSQLQILRP